MPAVPVTSPCIARPRRLQPVAIVASGAAQLLDPAFGEFDGRSPRKVRQARNNRANVRARSLVQTEIGRVAAATARRGHATAIESGQVFPGRHAVPALERDREIGARGLRGIIEQVLLDVMFEIPGRPDIRRVIVNRDVIEGRTHPLILTESDVPLEWSDDGTLQSAA